MVFHQIICNNQCLEYQLLPWVSYVPHKNVILLSLFPFWFHSYLIKITKHFVKSTLQCTLPASSLYSQ